MSRAVFIAFLGFTCLTGGTAQADPACPPGFSMLQDSSACVRVSGRVRAEGIVGSTRNRSDNGVTTQASGRVQLDVRKQTEYGPLRAVIAVQGIGRN